MAKKEDAPSKISLASLTDEEAIFKAVRNQCLQSPITIIPLALAGGLALLTGAFGLGFFGVFSAIVFGVLGGAAFVYNLWVRGETLAKRHVHWLMEQIKKERHSALPEIEEKCRKIGLTEAAKEASELSEAYTHYTRFLESSASSKLGNMVGQRLSLAESARQAGAAHLSQAAEMHTALAAINITLLQHEHSAWSHEKEHGNASISAALESKLASHSLQIERYQQLATERDRHIARSNELEAAIKNAHMADAGRSDLTLQQGSDDPAARLSHVVAAAAAAETDMKEFLQNIHQETPTQL